MAMVSKLLSPNKVKENMQKIPSTSCLEIDHKRILFI